MRKTSLLFSGLALGASVHLMANRITVVEEANWGPLLAQLTSDNALDLRGELVTWFLPGGIVLMLLLW